MNKIPPEIRESIIEHLLVISPRATKRAPCVLAPYAPISRLWQYSIERRTFNSLDITSDDLEDFEALFTGNNIRRREVLTFLQVAFVLPTPPDGTGCCPVERKPDREADSKSFSQSMAKLFSVLSDVESRAGEVAPLKMELWTRRRMPESRFPTGTSRVPCMRYDNKRHSRREVAEAKAQYGTFKLLDEDKLPTLQQVTALELNCHWELQDAEHDWISKVVGKTPQIENLSIQIADYYDFGRDRRLAMREGTGSGHFHFAKLTIEGLTTAITSIPGDCLKQLKLYVGHMPVLNENIQPPILFRDGQWDKESWFSLVKHASAAFPSLITLELWGGLVVCPQFFRCIDQGSFPSLEEFTLEFAPETADGRWFYERDEEYVEPDDAEDTEDSDDSDEEEDDDRSVVSWEDFNVFEDGPLKTNVVKEHIFRGKPGETTLFPFLMESANAVQRLPQLKKFILKLDDTSRPWYRGAPSCFQLWYLKAGTPRSPKGVFPKVYSDAKYLLQNRLYWGVEKWAPWDEVQAAWSRIVGPDAKTVYLEDDMWAQENGMFRKWVYEGDF